MIALFANAQPELTLFAAIGFLVGGLVLLGLGADWMVRGASKLALRLRLTPTVIGLTVVALGTSLPELMVSVSAQIDIIGNPESTGSAIAWGNVVGSNIFNIGLVLGLCALLRPLPVAGSTVRTEYPFMLGSAIILAPIIYSSAGAYRIDRLEGIFMLALFTGFTIFVIRVARKNVSASERAALEQEVMEVSGPPEKQGSWVGPTVWVVVGSAGLAFGGSLLVDGAQSLALHMGMTPRIVSIIIVASLTGFPELITTAVAVYRNETDMAVANVVGSNIFNTLLVLGAAGVVYPLDVPAEGVVIDLAVMVGITVLLGPLLLGSLLKRGQAALLLAGYCGYLGYLLLR